MIKDLEVIVNEPFDAELIKGLYVDPMDLKLAFPKAKQPFCVTEWTDFFKNDPNNSSLVFKHQEKIIGHLALIPNADDLYLCFVILINEYRGQGWADKLVLEAEEFCRLNYPHDQLYLNVDKKNFKAQNLYIRMGYTYCGDEGDKFKMKKEL